MILEIHDLSKRYGPVEVLKHLELQIEAGGIVGILGPNGVGKTTLVETIEGLRVASSGSIRVLGLDPASDASRLRERIGIQLQSVVLPAELTPLETLRLFGAFYRRAKPPAELLGTTGLTSVARVLNGRLSMGQQRRLAIALALVNDPELVLLDEPSSGLDPVARREMHTHLAALRTAGRTVILTSHDLEEVERLCDRVLFLKDGRIVADGSPAELAARSSGMASLWIAVEGAFDPAPLLRAGARAQGTRGGYLSFGVTEPSAVLVALGGLLERGDLTLTGLQMKRPGLEDFYLEVMGEGDNGNRVVREAP